MSVCRACELGQLCDRHDRPAPVPRWLTRAWRALRRPHFRPPARPEARRGGRVPEGNPPPPPRTRPAPPPPPPSGPPWWAA